MCSATVCEFSNKFHIKLRDLKENNITQVSNDGLFYMFMLAEPWQLIDDESNETESVIRNLYNLKYIYIYIQGDQ
jgi:hypothetical protein